MINFNTGHHREPWPTTLDQEGNAVTEGMVQREFHSKFTQLLEAKLPEFEAALKKRCEERNEVYVNMGFDQRFDTTIYQVGMAVFCINVSPDGLTPQQIGQIG